MYEYKRSGHSLTLDPGSHSIKISNSSSEATGPFVTKFNIKPSGIEGTNICQNGLGHITNMATMPVDSKCLPKFSSLEPVDRWP